MSQYIILLPPPCTNSDLHMGHLAGAFIPGDVYARYLSMNGHDVKVVCAADQNNTYTELKSQKLKKSFQYTKKFFAQKIKKSLESAKIHLDSFPMTSSQKHNQLAIHVVKKLFDSNLLAIKEVSQLHCDTCDKYVFDTIVRGYCGNCHSKADGAICENCNGPRFNKQLINATHIECHNKTNFKTTRALVLNITQLKSTLTELIDASDWNARLKNKYLEYLSQEEVEDIVMTYHYENGIKIESDSLEAKTLTIWFEAVWSSFTALLEIYDTNLKNLLEKLNSSETYIVPFMGQDTEFYYSVAFSAVLVGLGINKIPKNLSVQRFVKLNGMKFSSSRNHIISIDQLKKTFSIDTIRLYSISILSSFFSNSNDFNIKDLENLSNNFNFFKKRLLSHYAFWKNKSNFLYVHDDICLIIYNYHSAMNDLNFSKVYNEIDNLIQFIIKNNSQTALNIEIGCCLLMLAPIMPDVTKALGQRFYGNQWADLNLQDIVNKRITPIFNSHKNSHFNAAHRRVS